MNTDTLNATATEIEKTITNLGIKTYHCENLELLWTGELETDPSGAALDNPPVILEWDGSHEGYRGFLKIARSMSVGLVYAKVNRFASQRELYEFMESDPEIPAKEELRMKSTAEKYRAYDGYVSYILLAFKLGDAWHTYQEMAPWYRQYMDLMEGFEPPRQEK